jgi:DNA-binding GntR family transcriptional regulator
VLKADGLVEGRQGQGVFVKACRRTSRHLLMLGASVQADVTEQIKADRHIAERLALTLGDVVMHTRSRPTAADGSLHIVETWRPLARPTSRVGDTTQERVIVRPATLRRSSTWSCLHVARSS